MQKRSGTPGVRGLEALNALHVLSLHQQRRLEEFFLEAHKKARVSWPDAFAYARLAMKVIKSTATSQMALIITILVFFGTAILIPFDLLDLGPRIGMVIVTVVIGSIIGDTIAFFALTLHIRLSFNLWFMGIIRSVLSAFISSMVLPFVIRHVFEIDILTFAIMFPPALLVYGIGTVFVLWQNKSTICYREYRARHQNNGLNAMLPLEKRGDILLLSAADHYVDVFTKNGSEMLRMTMKSAVEKVEANSGMRVHRSHWVGFGAMLALNKIGERHVLTLKSGQHVPVSSQMLTDIQQALDMMPQRP